MKKGVILINCARGEIVNTADLVAALQSGQVGGYGADVLEQEPPPPDYALLRQPNCIITPHVGSRTFESVQRQATMSVKNLIAVLDGQKPLAQANSF
jgi:D-3-phosphoglycerate dehydrogenase